MTEKGRCRGRARLTSGVSGERSAAERVHCTPGLGRARAPGTRMHADPYLEEQQRTRRHG